MFQHALSELSKRELQIARQISTGLTNQAIGNKLFISERTVKFHAANIYKKLRVPNRATLIAKYHSELQS